eukprot:20873_1
MSQEQTSSVDDVLSTYYNLKQQVQQKRMQMKNMHSELEQLTVELKLETESKSQQEEKNTESTDVKTDEKKQSQLHINVGAGDIEFEHLLRNIQDDWVKEEIRDYPWGNGGLDILVLGQYKNEVEKLLQSNVVLWTCFNEEAMINQIQYNKPLQEFIKKYNNKIVRNNEVGMVYGHIFDPPDDVIKMKHGDIVHIIFYNGKKNAFIETKIRKSSIYAPKPEYGGFTAIGVTNGTVNRMVSRQSSAKFKGQKEIKSCYKKPMFIYDGTTASVYSYRGMHLFVNTFGMMSFPMIYGSHIVNFTKKQSQEAEQKYLNENHLVNAHNYDGFISKALNHDNAVKSKEDQKEVGRKKQKYFQKKKQVKLMKYIAKNIKVDDRISKCYHCNFVITESSCIASVGIGTIQTKDDAYNRATGGHWGTLDGNHCETGKRYEHTGMYWTKRDAVKDIASSLGLIQRVALEKGKSDQWLRKIGIIDRCFSGFEDK